MADLNNDKTVLRLLRKKIDELGRRPTLGDIEEDPQLRSVHFRKRFGNLNKAIDRAYNLDVTSVPKTRQEKEELVLALLEEIDAHGYMLSRIEIDYCPNLEDSSVYEKCFGGWSCFLTYLNRRLPSLQVTKPSRECLISSLRLKAAEKPSGEPIKLIDITKDKRMPSYHFYGQIFGGFTNALAAAGLSSASARLSDNELLVLLCKKAEELGRQPTRYDVNKDKRLPDSTTYGNRFHKKPWNEILKLAGLDRMPSKQTLSVEEKKADAIEEIRSVAKRLGRSPKRSDIRRAGGLSHSETFYIKYFGSFNDAVVAAGLVQMKRTEVTDAELIEELRCKADELGYQPSSSDISRDPNMHSTAAFYGHFGTPWAQVIEAAGLSDLPIKPVFTTEQKLAAAIKELQAAAERLGRTPRYSDLRHKTDDTPHNSSYYAYLFGSFQKALQAAGFEPVDYKKTPRSPH